MLKIKAFGRFAGTILLMLVTGLFAYLAGYHTRDPELRASQRWHPTVSAPIHVNAWAYPGAARASSFSSSDGGSSGSRLKEAFPGSSYIGASQTIMDTDTGSNADGATFTTPDSLEKVYAYYAQRLKLLGGMAVFRMGMVGAGSSVPMGSINIENGVTQDMKQSAIVCSGGSNLLLIFLSRAKTAPKTDIFLYSCTTSIHITKTVQNPPMLPGLMH